MAAGLVAGLACAGMAAAQDKPRSRITVVIKAPPAGPAPSAMARPASSGSGQPVLRKPLAPVIAGDPTSVAPSLAKLGLLQAAAVGGPGPLKGLNPPSALGQAAQCRARCSERRYTCTAREAGDCDTVWGACVVRCSGANYRQTPDLAQRATTPVRR